jgi:hypothetical protein
MADQQQDILSQALLELQDELATFGKVQHALKNAHEQLTKAEQEWDKLTKEQQQTALELVGATNAAISATHAVTSQAESLTGALIPLARAIENVNFPLRLDKIDMAVSTQASTMASFQGTTERGFTDLRAEMEKGRKRDIMITTLLIFNTAVLIVFAVLFHLGIISTFAK